MTAEPLTSLLAHRRVVVCCGSGGVGKTTTAAALAQAAAAAGRRAVVVTIDPARRLADALGLESLSNSPSVVEGPWPGSLHALMLDTERTFDELVVRTARSPEQAERILGNRFYRNIAGALSGTQEYMATEKLFELHESDAFDVIVVDTPPSRNALDFLDAPQRLARFLDHRLYRTLTVPTKGFVRAVNMAAQNVLRSIGKVVGGEVIADAIAFFAAFEGMDDGFKERAIRVDRLLGSHETAFLLITAPKADAVAEATYFASKLAEHEISVAAMIVNRVHPDPGPGDVELERRLARHPETALGAAAQATLDLRAMVHSEAEHLSDILRQVAPAPVIRVPYLPVEVHDLAGLERFAELLLDAANN